MMLVWINSEEYDNFLNELGNHGFTWKSGAKAGDKKSILERVHDPNYSVVYYIDLENKKLSYFPLEIYDKNSPTRDDEKFEKYKSQCKSCEFILGEIKRMELGLPK